MKSERDLLDAIEDKKEKRKRKKTDLRGVKRPGVLCQANLKETFMEWIFSGRSL